MLGGLYDRKLVNLNIMVIIVKFVTYSINFIKFMLQVDGLTHVGNMVDRTLIEDTRRVSILHEMAPSIRELIWRHGYAHPSDAPKFLIVYAQRQRQPLDTESEGAQKELGPSQLDACDVEMTMRSSDMMS